MTHRSQYTDDVLNEMQLLYGEGYLSPGGAEEVDAILHGISLQSCRVLDLGCGVGGAAIRITRDLGAASVVGMDVEARSIERANAAAEAAGLSGQISFECLAPGPIPVQDESFDIVFLKDVFCHLEDKQPLFREINRVLRKGGVLAFSAWTTGIATMPGDTQTPRVVRRPDGLVLYFEPLTHYVNGLERSGFSSVVTNEHSNELLARTRSELDKVMALQRLHPDSGKMEQRIKVTERRLDSLQTGRLEHWHLRAARAL